jgi:hypothetical protein
MHEADFINFGIGEVTHIYGTFKKPLLLEKPAYEGRYGLGMQRTWGHEKCLHNFCWKAYRAETSRKTYT